jgi:hypothetical protein
LPGSCEPRLHHTAFVLYRTAFRSAVAQSD